MVRLVSTCRDNWDVYGGTLGRLERRHHHACRLAASASSTQRTGHGVDGSRDVTAGNQCRSARVAILYRRCKASRIHGRALDGAASFQFTV